MSPIQAYIDQIFAAYPKTPELEALKVEFLGNMEERYQALLLEGKSSAEALGTVILEFGDMEELAKELNITQNSKQYTEKNKTTNTVESDIYTLPVEEAMFYLDTMKKSSLFTSLGIGLTIFSPSFIIFSSALNIEMLGLMLFFIILAIGIGTIIYGGFQEEKSGEKFLKNNSFQIDTITERLVTDRKVKESKWIHLFLAVGIGFTVLCPMPLFFFGMFSERIMEAMGVPALLLFVAIGVFLIVFSGNYEDAFKRILKIKSDKKGGRKPFQGSSAGETNHMGSVQYFQKKTHQKSELENLVSSIFWSAVLIVFLITGFVFHIWYINWIIWPIAGVFHTIIESILYYYLKDTFPIY